MGVPVGSFYLKHPVTKLKDGYVKGSTSKVIDNDSLILIFFVQTISQRSGCGLIDNTLHIQAGNFSGFLCCLTLSIIKIGRNSDHSLRYFFTQILLSGLLHFLKRHRRNFLRCIKTVVNFDTCRAVIRFLHFVGYLVDFAGNLIKHPSHKALYRSNCFFRVRNRLSLGRCTDNSFAIFGKGHDRWSRTSTF